MEIALACQRRTSGWWITGTWPYKVDGVEYTDYGPYATKDEAREALAAIRRTMEEIATDEHATSSTPGLDAVGTTAPARQQLALPFAS